MKLYTRLLRAELSAINKISDIFPLDKSRVVMNRMGKALSMRHGSSVEYINAESERISVKFIVPRVPKRDGLILYLHGGGYVLGGTDYAKGFGTLIAAETGMRVCAVDYRLAPEHKFPAAVSDAYRAYHFVMSKGYSPDKIVLCGESAGGGLVYSLVLKLKENGCPLPRGIIAFSPWSDLTLSGSSYTANRGKDPSMTEKRLRFYAESYTSQPECPYASPLFGDLTGFPPSVILAGGDEIMLSDSVSLHEKLLSHGCVSRLNTAPHMWHVYLMYNTAEAREGYIIINSFLEDLFNGK